MANRPGKVTSTVPINGIGRTSRSSFSLPLHTITPESVQDPVQLAKVLSSITDNQGSTNRSIGSSPFSNACILTGISLTANVQVNLSHSLGQNWKYAFVIHHYPGSQACSLIESCTVPTGLTKSTNCSLVPTGTGVYDIAIC